MIDPESSSVNLAVGIHFDYPILLVSPMVNDFAYVSLDVVDHCLVDHLSGVGPRKPMPVEHCCSDGHTVRHCLVVVVSVSLDVLVVVSN